MSRSSCVAALGIAIACQPSRADPAGTSQPTTSSAREAPATVTFHAVHRGKPPMLLYTVTLELINRHDQAMWFVMRSWGDKPLPAADRSVSREQGGFYFGREWLSRGERRPYATTRPTSECVTCCYSGGFVACRLDAHAELRVDDCEIKTVGAPLRDFEVWEVKDILVNDREPLAAWLGTRVEAPEGHYATLTAGNRDRREPTRIDRGAVQQRIDVVKSITMDVARRWTLPIADLPTVPIEPER